MKARIVLLLMMLAVSATSFAQFKLQGRIDSMRSLLPPMKDDTNKVKLLNALSAEYYGLTPDSVLVYAERALALSRRIGWKKGEASAHDNLSRYAVSKGDDTSALQSLKTALQINEEIGDKAEMARNCRGIATTYTTMGNYSEGLKYNLRSLKIAEEIDDKKIILYSHLSIGLCYFAVSDYPNALSSVLKGLSIAEKRGNLQEIQRASSLLATVYTPIDLPKALEWALKTLSIDEQLGDERAIAFSSSNIQDIYAKQDNRAKATEWYWKSFKAYAKLGDSVQMARLWNTYGVLLRHRRDYDSADFYHRRSLQFARAKGRRSMEISIFRYLSINYFFWAKDSLLNLTPAARAAMLDSSLHYSGPVALFSKEFGNLDDYSEQMKGIAGTYYLKGDYAPSLEAYKESVKYRDSVHNKENDRKLLSAGMKYESQKAQDSIRFEEEKRAIALQEQAQSEALHREYQRKQAAAKSEKERELLRYEESLKSQEAAARNREKAAAREAEYQRKTALAAAAEDRRSAMAQAQLRQQQFQLSISLGVAALLLLVGFVSYRAYRQRSQANLVINREREKSEALLRNILPAGVAAELKQQGQVVARQFDDTSVLFTNFVDFTATSQALSPQAMVKELHECFSAFDEIIRRNGLEKIKTIGDTYMAVCGVPESDPRHAKRCVQAGLDILAFMDSRARRERVFGIRIGINSGPVLAGVVGVRKFAYDIWGDTVNTAARMEQHGESGRINISESAYELVRDEFACTRRGKIAAKHKGEVEMYFVTAGVPANLQVHL